MTATQQKTTTKTGGKKEKKQSNKQGNRHTPSDTMQVQRTAKNKRLRKERHAAKMRADAAKKKKEQMRRHEYIPDHVDKPHNLNADTINKSMRDTIAKFVFTEDPNGKPGFKYLGKNIRRKNQQAA